MGPLGGNQAVRVEFQVYARKSLDRLVERNINIKDHSAEISERNKQHDFGNWQKVDPSYKVAKNLAEFYSRVLWKAELMSDEIEYLAEKISQKDRVYTPSIFSSFLLNRFCLNHYYF